MHRYIVYLLAILMFPICLWLATIWPAWYWGVGLTAAMVALGTWDLLQKRSTLRRNYPVMAHFRYGLESIGPEIRQYFVQSDLEDVPFSRQQRALIYQRAKNEMDTVPFGTLRSTYAVDYEWINHSLAPTSIAKHDFRVLIGANCAKPYSTTVFNISAMSFGALSGNAIRALNRGAKLGNFIHDTGEGSISPYHREEGGDLIWEVASGYFGCRDANGRFDPDRFAEQARSPQVKMIEVKLSQGAKPGHGGVLPAAKVTPEIAATRGIQIGKDCISPAAHSEFSTPLGLLQFVDRLRTLSGGKPTGFKLCIGHPWEFFGIVKAMLESGILPDFIVVDGAEGGTGAAPLEFTDHVGTPLQEGLLLVHNTLVGTNLRDKIKIGASGKIVTAFDVARTLAMGADWCNAARGFMFALGCIQAQKCHTDRCPTGVATQDPSRQKALVVPDKAERVHQYHAHTLHALLELTQAAGLQHPADFRAHHIVRRVSGNEVQLLSTLLKYLEPGDLLAGRYRYQLYERYWPMAQAERFDAVAV
jgi:glutamate synthase domain-containing protein 2